MAITKEIKTSGELRKFLLGMMVGIKDGDVKVPEATAIFKMASQIHESLYSEIKTNQLLQALGKGTQPIGDLAITEPKADGQA